MSNRGFTLVEILLVIGVIAILAIAVFVVYTKVRDAAQDREVVGAILTINSSSVSATNLPWNAGGPGQMSYLQIARKTWPRRDRYDQPITPWGGVSFFAQDLYGRGVSLDKLPTHTCLELTGRLAPLATSIRVIDKNNTQTWLKNNRTPRVAYTLANAIVKCQPEPIWVIITY